MCLLSSSCCYLFYDSVIDCFVDTTTEAFIYQSIGGVPATERVSKGTKQDDLRV